MITRYRYMMTLGVVYIKIVQYISLHISIQDSSSDNESQFKITTNHTICGKNNKYIFTHAPTIAHTYVYIHIYTHTYVHSYTHTYNTHTHTHIYRMHINNITNRRNIYITDRWPHDKQADQWSVTTHSIKWFYRYQSDTEWSTY